MRSAVLLCSTLLTSVLCVAQEGGQAPAEGTVPAMKDMAPAELSEMIGSNTVIVYDCNEADTYEWAHVPGAILTVYDEVTAEKLPADHSAAIVFYCYSPECPAAGMAARTAVELGYTNVRYMSAGITGWQDAGLPTEPK